MKCEVSKDLNAERAKEYTQRTAEVLCGSLRVFSPRPLRFLPFHEKF